MTTIRHLRRPLALAIAGALAGLALPAGADAPGVDTSQWKCESCPFVTGYHASATAGAEYVDGGNASYGRWTGRDEQQAYAAVGAEGDWRGADGLYANYALEDLGLDSRSGSIRVGRAGRYDVGLSYDGLPWRRFDTTVTPYSGTANLTLPGNWVRSFNTAGMTRLAAALGDRDVGTLRKRYGLDARYLAGTHWALTADYRREDRQGTGQTWGSFLTQSIQLPEPIDQVNDTFEVGLAYASERVNARVAYSGSFFRNQNTALTFQNPYLPIVASATTGRLALAPDNDAQQFALTGSVRLPYSATLAWNASVGRLKQDDALLPVSTAPAATTPKPSLDGEVRLSHYGLALALRPLAKLALRGTARYDERDDRTDPLAISYVVTDVFPGGTETTPRYGYKRTRLDGSADYTLLPWLRVGGELRSDEIRRSEQEIAKTAEDGGALRARLAPWPSLSLTLKGGQLHRDAKGFDLTRVDPAENPLLRKYNLANRDRQFYEAVIGWSASAKLDVSLQGRLTNDAYRRSPLGLTDGHTRAGGATLTWTPAESLSLYLDGGWQTQRSKQLGQARPSGPLWEARNEDEFWNAGTGARWTVNPKLSLTGDYVHAESTGRTRVLIGTASDAYPTVRTRLGSVRLGAHWQWSDALSLHARVVVENYDEDNWAFDDIGPATLPGYLSMAPQADSHDVGLLAFTFTWRFGTVAATAAPE